MTVLVTGAAGFIGYHVCKALMQRGERVIGLDELNAYYDVSLKEARRDRLLRHNAFSFRRIDIADRESMDRFAADHPQITRVVHLAAQAGVRYSLENPFAYLHANLTGHFVVLELCRQLRRLDHLVYASSSSVYGGNTKVPFATSDRTDTPISLYAATKKADELISHCYSHLHRLPATGLRFFTVYGPWGRPDMAAYIFTKAIHAGRPIRLFNHGDMKRDFTYIDDIVAGVLACLDRPPPAGGLAPHRVYNLGNNRPEDLTRFVALIEQAVGRKAEIVYEPMQPGDVKATCADISDTQREFGFEPRTPIDVGIPRFVEWYRRYHGVAS